MAALDLLRWAHSIVRRSLGFKMIGNSTDAVCGVEDVYPLINFPDIRKKAVMRTKVGSLLIIPRESVFLPRFYIKLPKGKTQKRSCWTTYNLLHAGFSILINWNLRIRSGGLHTLTRGGTKISSPKTIKCSTVPCKRRMLYVFTQGGSSN